MQVVKIEEFINSKILPFNIYDESGNLLFKAGEVLTDGKVLRLRAHDLFYRDENQKKFEQIIDLEQKVNVAAKQNNKLTESKTESAAEPEVMPAVKKPAVKKKISIDEVDISNYEGFINKKSAINPDLQMKLQQFHFNALNNINKVPKNTTLEHYYALRDRIMHEVSSHAHKVRLSSQLRLISENLDCHSLNVAILSTILASKLGLSDGDVSNITLGALLHDIGKTRLPEEIRKKQILNREEAIIVESHTRLGYEIIMKEFKLSEKIALIAFEHHERSDGTGYPRHKSSHQIDLSSKIVGLCDFYDNLTSKKTSHKVENAKNAMRVLLEVGSKYFSTDILYKFVHMFDYSDLSTFEQIAL